MPRKDTVLTFKTDPALATALRALPNRSDFIRAAVLAALDNACPLCGGSGLLSPKQKEHWEQLRASHRITKCGDCDELVMVCDRHDRRHPRGRRAR
ncbi:MAG TPA: CopG family transcriptional regulator [bacterium]|nr:CopG family transcriptional regulator [bacterium]